MTKPIQLILAPSNLGLRPPRPGHEPGTWRAPDALLAAGLEQSVGAVGVEALSKPGYDFQRQTGTGWRNGHGIRAFNLALADLVAKSLHSSALPLVIGGDCSILLGCLAGARRSGEVALLHVDGHSDFRNPRNFDFEAEIGAAAGADLALAIGLGEPLLTEWGQAGPLVAERHVIQIGEREGSDPDWQWRDIAATAITRRTIFTVLEQGIAATLDEARRVVAELPFWVHLDLDVIDATLLSAVDSPGRPGLDFTQAAELLRPLLADPNCLGCDVTIYDPELDPDGIEARRIVELLAKVS